MAVSVSVAVSRWHRGMTSSEPVEILIEMAAFGRPLKKPWRGENAGLDAARAYHDDSDASKGGARHLDCGSGLMERSLAGGR